MDEQKYDVALPLIMRGGRLNDLNPFEQLINLAREVEELDENTVKFLLSRGKNGADKVEFKMLLQIIDVAAKSCHFLTKNINISYRDPQNNTPMHIGVKMNSLHVVKASIEKANVNECGWLVNEKNKDGNTPLHLTKDLEDVEIARFLLENGAALEAKNRNENTPLHLATLSNNLHIVQLLIEYGADIEALNESENTPLHLAIEMNYFEIFEVLVANEANIKKSRKRDGNTPLWYTQNE